MREGPTLSSPDLPRESQEANPATSPCRLVSHSPCFLRADCACFGAGFAFAFVLAFGVSTFAASASLSVTAGVLIEVAFG